MAHIEVRDRVLWIKHIHGAVPLARRLEKLKGGAAVRLRVAGMSGLWEKMKDKPDGKPTPGLKPVGPVSEYWQSLFNTKRGELVDIELEDGKAPPDPAREAAWAAFEALTKAGWRSEGEGLSRDELHDR